MDAFLSIETQLVNSITVFGDIGSRVYGILKRQGNPCTVVHEMQDAIAYTLGISEVGDSILFSPSSSSFDQFNNFEHRGNVFKDIINAL